MAITASSPLRVQPWVLDGAATAAIVVSGLLTTTNLGPGERHRDTLALALILVATLPYALRRRAPLPVFAVTMVAVVVLMLARYGEGVLPLVDVLGAYTVAAYRPVREILAAAALGAVLLTALLVGSVPGFGVGEFVASAGTFGTAFLIGWTLQSRRREHAASAAQAVADERLRIAQELHDVVAHSLGVIAVQAGVGMHLIDTDPAEARRALANISGTSRTSLAEIRRLLGMVRDGTGAAYRPAPGLADLPDLVREISGAGLPVDLDVDLRDVPPGVELAAYRIVQEALTNVLRHAEAQRARVRVGGESGLLRVEVTDDGRGPGRGTSSGGHGLVGMRERVAVYGGTLEAGPGPGIGFRVAAELPYDEEPAA